MKWFWKAKSGVEAANKKDLPADLWLKCPECKEILYQKELRANLSVCQYCQFHFSITAQDYLQLLLDENTFQEFNSDWRSRDPLGFVDKKPYKDRLKDYEKKTGLTAAVICGEGMMNGRLVTIGVMDFRFNGGSMGTVEGEKLAWVLRRAIKNKCPAIILSKSGGARMQEGTLSLMQMAKTSAFISLLDKEGLPYISILTNPTTGGVTASVAMLGDFNISEPGALIGFAGSRVIRETIRENLPPNFQRAELLLKKGFIDKIVARKDLKEVVASLLEHLMWKKSSGEKTPSIA